jgi:hypothetical protein
MSLVGGLLDIFIQAFTSYDGPRLLPQLPVIGIAIVEHDEIPLNLEHSVQNISFLSINENILRLMKYRHKFHLFLKVKDETLLSWHSHSSLIFLQSLYYTTTGHFFLIRNFELASL